MSCLWKILFTSKRYTFGDFLTNAHRHIPSLVKNSSLWIIMDFVEEAEVPWGKTGVFFFLQTTYICFLSSHVREISCWCELDPSRASLTILGKISEQQQQQMNGSLSNRLKSFHQKKTLLFVEHLMFFLSRHVSPKFLEKGSGRPVPLTSAWAASSTHSGWSHDCLAAGGYNSAVYQF